MATAAAAPSAVMHSTFTGASRRRIFVGDVHGCQRELDALLAQVEYDRHQDTLVLVGDMLRKGPSSLDVLRFCRGDAAPLCVRGNHEEKLLRDHRKGATGDEWTTNMSPADWAWLGTLPHTIDFPRDNVLAVHAGLMRGVALEDQSVWDMTEMRFVVEGVATNTAPASHPTHRRWAADWSGPRCIVFGHDAAAGLQTHPHAIGLDSGCVYGKALTALVCTNDGERVIVTQPSFEQYCKPTRNDQ